MGIANIACAKRASLGQNLSSVQTVNYKQWLCCLCVCASNLNVSLREPIKSCPICVADTSIFRIVYLYIQINLVLRFQESQIERLSIAFSKMLIDGVCWLIYIYIYIYEYRISECLYCPSKLSSNFSLKFIQVIDWLHVTDLSTYSYCTLGPLSKCR